MAIKSIHFHFQLSLISVLFPLFDLFLAVNSLGVFYNPKGPLHVKVIKMGKRRSTIFYDIPNFPLFIIFPSFFCVFEIFFFSNIKQLTDKKAKIYVMVGLSLTAKWVRIKMRDQILKKMRKEIFVFPFHRLMNVPT